MSNLEDTIRAIVAKQLGVDKDKVTRDAHFTDDLGADSLETVELVLALEEEFDIQIPDEDAAKIHTLGSILAYVAAKAPAKV